MLSRTTLSQDISNRAQATSAPLVGVRWQPVLEALQLPTTLRGFLLFVLSLLVLAGAMSIHVMLSSDIMRLQMQLSNLQSVEARIERQNANLLREIMRNADLHTLHDQALAAGYTPVRTRTYVVEQPVAPIVPLTMAPGDANDLAMQTSESEATTLPDQQTSTNRLENWRNWVVETFNIQDWVKFVAGD